jgi:hypothetical protein
VIDRVLATHAHALFDCALAVTADSDLAVEAVREAVMAAVEEHGPNVELPTVLGAVLEAALRRAEAPGPLERGLLEAGDGSLEELQRVAGAAAQALDPRLRGILELNLRHGLEGEALSEVLGVPPGLVAATTQEALQQAEHLVGAVLLARVGQDDCPGLAAVLDDLDPVDAEKLAVGITEHLEGCSTCGDRRRALVPVTTLLAGLPTRSAPAALRRPTAHQSPPGAARGRAIRRRRSQLQGIVAGALGVALAILVGGLAFARWDRPGSRAVAAPATGRLSLPTQALDFGPTGVDGSFEVANTGREPLLFRVRPGVSWLGVADIERTLPAGQHVAVTVSLDRASAPEGDATGEVRVMSSGGSGVVPVHAGVERPPGLSGVEATPQGVTRAGCPGSTPAQVRAAVVEESGIARVELHWRPPARAEQVAPMTGEATSFLGALGPFTKAGDVPWWVSATDIRGNRTTSSPQVLRVSGC